MKSGASKVIVILTELKIYLNSEEPGQFNAMKELIFIFCSSLKEKQVGVTLFSNDETTLTFYFWNFDDSISCRTLNIFPAVMSHRNISNHNSARVSLNQCPSYLLFLIFCINFASCPIIQIVHRKHFPYFERFFL